MSEEIEVVPNPPASRREVEGKLLIALLWKIRCARAVLSELNTMGQQGRIVTCDKTPSWPTYQRAVMELNDLENTWFNRYS